MIEPIERYLIDSFEQLNETQNYVIRNLRVPVDKGMSACGSDSFARFQRLVGYQKQPLDLSAAIEKTGDGLHAWSQVDPSGREPEEGAPF